MADHSTSLRALAHPLRLRMLSLLTGTELSAAEVARALDVTHANASYHLRVLLDAGEIVEAGTEQIRGGRAKRYRHPWRSEDRPTPTPADADTYPLTLRAMGDELQRRAHHRARPGQTLTTDAELWVTPEIWGEAFELLKQAATLLHATAQPPHTEGTVHVNLTAAAFVMTDAPRDPS